MSLDQGMQALQLELAALFGDVGAYKGTPVFAKRFAQAVYNFSITPVVQTVLTNVPGAIVGYVTAGPVIAAGLGGFDKPIGGTGLAAAKEVLEQDLVMLWTHGGKVTSAPEYAMKHAMVLYKYYSQAIIITADTSGTPLPAAGVVTGPTVGIGGDLSVAPGMGFKAAQPILEQAFLGIWNQVQSPVSVAEEAKKQAEALHNFFIQGIVNTVGVIVAPAVTDPITGSGVYSVGTGTAVGTIS